MYRLPQQLLRSPLEASLALPDFAAHRCCRKISHLLSSQRLLQVLLEKTAHRHACLAVLENLPLNHSLTILLAMLEEKNSWNTACCAA
jgi:hypothetical protein